MTPTNATACPRRNDLYGVGYDPHREAPEFAQSSAAATLLSEAAGAGALIPAAGSAMVARPGAAGTGGGGAFGGGGSNPYDDEIDCYAGTDMALFDMALDMPPGADAGSDRSRSGGAGRRLLLTQAPDGSPPSASQPPKLLMAPRDPRSLRGFVRADAPLPSPHMFEVSARLFTRTPNEPPRAGAAAHAAWPRPGTGSRGACRLS